MERSQDQIMQEKKNGTRSSWELPEDVPYGAVENNKPDQGQLGQDKPTDIPTNYENKHVSYQDENHFEVKREPGRLG